MNIPPNLNLTKLFSPPDAFTDQRTHGYQGPSRYVRLGRVAPSGTASMARSEDGTRCAVAGKESLRIVRVSNPGPGQVSDHKSAIGPGGHKLEASRNFWDNSGLKVDSTSTDIAWGYGSFSNKILTSARNGELILWDLNNKGFGARYERRTKDHIRSINKLAVSHVVHYYCITGSADGDMRIWDLRDMSKSLMRVRHSTSIRSVAFSPSSWQPLQAIVGLDNGSIQRWDLKMGQRGGLDRLAVAHSAPVTTLDWCSTTGNKKGTPPNPADPSGNGLGWLVSGGLDKTVKVWDLTSPTASSHIPSKATYILHPSFPVRRVAWRPGYECELAVVSNDDMMVPNLDSPHFSVPGPAQGLLSRVGSGLGLDGMLRQFNSDNLSNFTKDKFTESLAETTKPHDGDTMEIWDVRREWVPKWSVSRASVDGSIADMAFHDSHSVWAQYSSGSFAQLDLRESTKPIVSINRVAATWDVAGSLTFVANKPSRFDPPYDDTQPVCRTAEKKPPGTKLKNQAFSTFITEDAIEDLETFTILARNYQFHGSNKKEICEANAEIAFQTGEERSSQVWRLLAISLADCIPQTPGPNQQPLSSGDPVPGIRFPSAPGNYSFPPVPNETSQPMANKWSPGNRSSSHVNQIAARSRSPSTSAPHRLTPSSSKSSSPLHLTMGLPVTPNRTNMFNRRQSIDSGVGSLRHPSAFRRPSLAVLQNTVSPSERGVLTSLRHVGEGALDDSSSSDGLEGDETVGAPSDDEQRSLSRQLLSPTALKPFPAPSPLRISRVPEQAQISEDEYSEGRGGVVRRDAKGAEVDDGAARDDADDEDEASSPSPRSTDTESDRSTSSRREAKSRSSSSRRVYHKLKSRSRSSTIASLPAPPRLIHQDSHSSIRTVTAGEGYVKERERGQAEMRPPPPLLEERSVGGAYGHRRHQSIPVQGYIQEMGPESEEEGGYSANLGETQVSNRGMDAVRAEERRFREIAWSALRKALDDFLDEGDVQMSAMMCLVAHGEMKVPVMKVVRIVESYLGASVETVIYSTCARCHKPIMRPAIPPLSSSAPSRGAFAFCQSCKKSTVRCSICHLPVRALLFQCSVCQHGGHQSCYRRYYMETAMLELPTSFSLHSSDLVEDRGRSLSRTVVDRSEASVETSVASTRSSVLGTSGPSPVRTESSVGGVQKMMGHPCASGCGHYCWAANMIFPTPEGFEKGDD
ncbi:hypothetical protein DFP72DRAFT_929836 [Ephemerocybe angulata]|uniref:WDR59/RTC1-like RING zinc finger domain-containing protein n=1 Tax=Ephemerocybe angulata TaxID=980116 RepID=A0A8H6HCB6_9AGAR|nr:hypothetical protein DFP72DRAFT_929836 [Tulosesus angulatus]